ncbi:MAG: hypothetical protein JW810_07405 [Sedimentisphaerales bacterium]|nr:hypothetical protein [Sedimentisphaerales bacterium]
MLRRILRALLGRKKVNPYTPIAACDIGAGSRVFPSNLDGNFPRLVHIGRNCLFAPHAVVLTHDASYYIHTGECKVAPVHIGDNCFIGYGAVIMPGVTIGDNVIVGAASVVTRDIPADSVAAGVPARILCRLEDYLQRRPRDLMIRAPYAGKDPAQISDADVVEYRNRVYAQYGIEIEPPTP